MNDLAADAIILADIGGTHIRLGTDRKAELDDVIKWPVRDFPTFIDALEKYKSEFGSAIDVNTLAIATAAWPVEDGVWGFARDDRWLISEKELSENGWDLKYIGNDFGASALGAVSRSHTDYHCLRSGDGSGSDTALVIGPGTGLGIAYVENQQGKLSMRETFGGHMICPASSFDQLTILKLVNQMKKEKHSLIAEHLVSGPGLVLIFKALCRMKGAYVPEDLSMHTMLSYREHPVFELSLKYFCEFLGMTVHQAVMYGHAFAGVYLDGGVIHHLIDHDLFDYHSFMDHFSRQPVESVKGAVNDTPIYIVNDPFIALKGLQHILKG